MTGRTKIAIACQGGGAQTAFTAGALKALLEAGVAEEFEIVAITGTSGGAICAALAWYSLLKGENPACQRLVDFWADNTVQSPVEAMLNDSTMKALRMVNRGQMMQLNVSPAAPWVQATTQMLTAGLRRNFADFPALLRTHIDFDELAGWGARPDQPILMMGAADVMSGRLGIFSSKNGPIRIEHILASCAVPNLFPAVELDGTAYWDGLFSDNPPIAETIDPRYADTRRIPEEIWVIKINSTTTDTVPVEADSIADRRNELIGNISLFQQIAALSRINHFVDIDAFRPEFLASFDVRKPIRMPKGFQEEPDRSWHIPFIEMSAELNRSLDYVSKLDRRPDHINRLMADGAAQARAFLMARRG